MLTRVSDNLKVIYGNTGLNKLYTKTFQSKVLDKQDMSDIIIVTIIMQQAYIKVIHYIYLFIYLLIFNI